MSSDVFPDYPYDPGVHAIWVVGRYDGERAKTVLVQARNSRGYIVLNESGNRYNPSCLVAFRHVPDGPLPPYLEEVRDPYKLQEYERLAGRG